MSSRPTLATLRHYLKTNKQNKYETLILKSKCSSLTSPIAEASNTHLIFYYVLWEKWGNVRDRTLQWSVGPRPRWSLWWHSESLDSRDQESASIPGSLQFCCYWEQIVCVLPAFISLYILVLCVPRLHVSSGAVCGADTMLSPEVFVFMMSFLRANTWICPVTQHLHWLAGVRLLAVWKLALAFADRPPFFSSEQGAPEGMRGDRWSALVAAPSSLHLLVPAQEKKDLFCDPRNLDAILPLFQDPPLQLQAAVALSCHLRSPCDPVCFLCFPTFSS